MWSQGFLSGSDGEEKPAMQETQVWPLGWEEPLEKDMATHSRVLAWEIPWTEDPGELQSWGRKESDTAEQLSMHTRTCPSHTP